MFITSPTSQFCDLYHPHYKSQVPTSESQPHSLSQVPAVETVPQCGGAITLWWFLANKTKPLSMSGNFSPQPVFDP